MNKVKMSKNFNPSLFHRFYFIRKGLLEGICNYAPFLKGNLLDFGCGSKPYRSLFNVESYTGLDFENPGHDHNNEQIDIFYDGRNIPFPNEKFDSILCSEVVEHLFDLSFTLGEMNRVLKKGGKILITCPFVWNEHELPYDFARYTEFALKDIFERHGFRILNFEKRGSFNETLTQLKVLNFVLSWESFFARYSRPGYFVFNIIIFMRNTLGEFRNWLFKKNYSLYLSNIILVEKQ